MRLGFLQKFVNKKINCFLQAVSELNRSLKFQCNRAFNTKLTPSVKHRISAFFWPTAAGSNKWLAQGQP